VHASKKHGQTCCFALSAWFLLVFWTLNDFCLINITTARQYFNKITKKLYQKILTNFRKTLLCQTLPSDVRLYLRSAFQHIFQHTPTFTISRTHSRTRTHANSTHSGMDPQMSDDVHKGFTIGTPAVKENSRPLPPTKILSTSDPDICVLINVESTPTGKQSFGLRCTLETVKTHIWKLTQCAMQFPSRFLTNFRLQFVVIFSQRLVGIKADALMCWHDNSREFVKKNFLNETVNPLG